MGEFLRHEPWRPGEGHQQVHHFLVGLAEEHHLDPRRLHFLVLRLRPRHQDQDIGRVEVLLPAKVVLKHDLSLQERVAELTHGFALLRVAEAKADILGHELERLLEDRDRDLGTPGFREALGQAAEDLRRFVGILILDQHVRQLRGHDLIQRLDAERRLQLGDPFVSPALFKVPVGFRH